MMDQQRALFDFRIGFTNGGFIQGKGFRLDVPGPDLAADDVGTLLVRHLGLLTVGDVRLHGLRFVVEPHRGSRNFEINTRTEWRLIDLSHPTGHGMVTYPGLPGHTGWTSTGGPSATASTLRSSRRVRPSGWLPRARAWSGSTR